MNDGFWCFVLYFAKFYFAKLTTAFTDILKCSTDTSMASVVARILLLNKSH